MLSPAHCRWAQATMRAATPATYWLLRLLLPEPGRRQFFAIYGFFRWADDTIDLGERGPAVQAFCAHQRALIDAGLAGQAAEPTQTAEAVLLAALAEPPRAALLRRAVRLMWSALECDAQRPDGPLSRDLLHTQICRVGDAYTAALLASLGLEDCPDPALWWLARAATATHHLRDLLEDQALGYHNIPQPDAEALGIDPCAFGAADARRYAEARAPAVYAMFRQGQPALLALPTWRARAVFGLLAWRYRRTLRSLAGPERAALGQPTPAQLAPASAPPA